jgi:hypothetical protein
LEKDDSLKFLELESSAQIQDSFKIQDLHLIQRSFLQGINGVGAVKP